MTDEPRPSARRPTEDDLPKVLEAIAEGKALRAVCREMGLHAPSTSTMLGRTTKDLRERYAHARADRVEVMGEEVLTIARAAALGAQVNGKKVDPAGARVFIDAVKWLAGRMDPKGEPVQRFAHSFERLTDDELNGEIASMTAELNADDGTGEP